MPQPASSGSPFTSMPLARKLGEGGVEVVAHEGELVGGRLGGVDGDLGRGEGEDQPAAAGVDVVPAEHVGHDRAQRVGVGGVEQDVGTGDRHGAILPAVATALPSGGHSPPSGPGTS